jgi:hypothetical protein
MPSKNGNLRLRRGGLRRRLSGERGIALPTAVMALMVVAMLASAAGMAAISAMGQSGHDRGTKRAVAAADAGIDTAIYRLNKLKPSSLLCVVVGLPLALDPVPSSGWCPPQTENLGDGASFSYRMSAGIQLNLAGVGLLQRKIVSTGTANGVTRRAMATVTSLTGVSVFGGNAVTTLSDLTLPSGTLVTGDVAADGNINVFNCTRLVGNALYGIGKLFNVGGSPSSCAGRSQVQATQHLVLNPVNQGTAATVNDNGRIGNQDPFVNVLSNWSPANRTLRLRFASTLTLTGNTYSFCKLEVENLSQLIIGPRIPTQPPLKIYMDAPENCPGVSGAGTITVKDTGQIINANATADTFQLSALGSPTTATTLSFQSTLSNMIGTFYAPRSTISLEKANAILGSVAAQNVTLLDSARIQWHPSADITLDDLYPLFKRTSWVECTTSPTGSSPESGC